MTSDQLRQQLLEQKKVINALQRAYCDKEQSHFVREIQLRKEAVDAQEAMREIMAKRNVEDKKLTESYYGKMVMTN